MNTFQGAPKEKKLTDTAIADSTAQKKTLKDLSIGEAAHIVDFFKENDAVKKIEAMGLRRGKRITIIQKLGRGIVVKISNSRIVITSDVAKNIEVE
ncbi:MAG: ferrous iron transport protein A [Bacteroidetes bacterium]|nr:ferrous iron transport protein A [Bacteroidota bacterium]MCL5267024.1 ferrous iron transport protein A [Bacteroidota bacterium]